MTDEDEFRTAADRGRHYPGRIPRNPDGGDYLTAGTHEIADLVRRLSVAAVRCENCARKVNGWRVCAGCGFCPACVEGNFPDAIAHARAHRTRGL